MYDIFASAHSAQLGRNKCASVRTMSPSGFKHFSKPTYTPPTPRLRPRHAPPGPALGQACLLCSALGGASKIAMKSKKKLFGGI